MHRALLSKTALPRAGGAEVKRPVPPKPWPRLTDRLLPADLVHCQLCGKSKPLRVYEECDESDKREARFLVACTGADCNRTIALHPRLYESVNNRPGSITQLCASCAHRDGLACRHPSLKANGGPGLLITLASPFPAGVIVCVKGARGLTIPRLATACAGRQLPAEPASPPVDDDTPPPF